MPSLAMTVNMPAGAILAMIEIAEGMDIPNCDAINCARLLQRMYERGMLDLSQFYDDEIRRMSEAGHPYHEIATLLNIRTSQVFRRMARMGIPIR